MRNACSMLKEISTALLFSRSSRVFIDGIVLNQEPGVRGKFFFAYFIKRALQKAFTRIFTCDESRQCQRVLESFNHGNIIDQVFFFVPYFTN